MTHQSTAGLSPVLTVITRGRIDRIPFDRIVRIEALSNYSKVILSNGKAIVVAKVLKTFEERLCGIPFIRTHKTHLVNLLFVRSYYGGANKTLELSNGDRISVARRKSKNVFRSLVENSSGISI